MGNEQSKLTIDVAFSPDVDQIPGNVITGVNPALLEVQYRSLTGDPAFILKIAYIYGVFATYILARIRAGVLDILGTGPFTDIADDTTYGVRAVFSIADYLPGDLYYMQISNLAWYIKERFYFMPGFAKFIVITPEEDLSAIKAQTDKLQFDGFNNIQARINDTNQLSLLTRILGLTHENVYTVNTFTGNTHTGSVIELYDTKANADLHDGVTGLIAKYTLTVYLTSGLPTSHKMVKEP